MTLEQSKAKYDEYLKTHIANVRKAYDWMIENKLLDDVFTSDAIKEASELVDKHDASKYSPEEYDGYRQYFNPTNKEISGVPPADWNPDDPIRGDREIFKYSWLHHNHNNPHHWEYHVLLNEDAPGTPTALLMPEPYVIEMLADWMSFSINAGDMTEVLTWYHEHKLKMILHDTTRGEVELVLKKVAEMNDLEFDTFTENMLSHKLNPKLWDDHGELIDEVEDKINEIVDEFVNGLNKDEIPIRVVDVWIVGSNASYNYTDNSDLDVHIIADLSNMNDPKLLKMVYDYYKSSFNRDLDIKIKGINVEVFVEDVNNSTTASKGIYSLTKQRWLKVADHYVPYVELEPELEQWIREYDDIMVRTELDELQKFLDDLYILRKVSLATEGEYGKGNLIFKDFRNRGYIDKIKEAINTAMSEKLSMESKSKLTEASGVFSTNADRLDWEDLTMTGLQKIIGSDDSSIDGDEIRVDYILDNTEAPDWYAKFYLSNDKSYLCYLFYDENDEVIYSGGSWENLQDFSIFAIIKHAQRIYQRMIDKGELKPMNKESFGSKVAKWYESKFESDDKVLESVDKILEKYDQGDIDAVVESMTDDDKKLIAEATGIVYESELDDLFNDTFVEEGIEYKWIEEHDSYTDPADNEWFVKSAKVTDNFGAEHYAIGDVYYFVVDEQDNIDWGPCDTIEEASDFMYAKVSDYDDDDYDESANCKEAYQTSDHMTLDELFLVIKMAKDIGLRTLDELDKFMKNPETDPEGIYGDKVHDRLLGYRASVGDDFKIAPGMESVTESVDKNEAELVTKYRDYYNRMRDYEAANKLYSDGMSQVEPTMPEKFDGFDDKVYEELKLTYDADEVTTDKITESVLVEDANQLYIIKDMEVFMEEDEIDATSELASTFDCSIENAKEGSIDVIGTKYNLSKFLHAIETDADELTELLNNAVEYKPAVTESGDDEFTDDGQYSDEGPADLDALGTDVDTTKVANKSDDEFIDVDPEVVPDLDTPEDEFDDIQGRQEFAKSQQSAAIPKAVQDDMNESGNKYPDGSYSNDPDASHIPSDPDHAFDDEFEDTGAFAEDVMNEDKVSYAELMSSAQGIMSEEE